jgi:flagellar biosynthesis/type III secretory pathway protein FliH
MAQRAILLREEATRQAERILADARVERQKIMEGAEERAAAEGHARGFARGTAEGHEAGKAQALEQWNEKFEEIAQAWEQALFDLEQTRERVLRTAQQDLLALGVAFAVRVARRAVQLDPHAAATQVRAVLERAANGSVVAVRVHPEDIESARAGLNGVLDRLADSRASVLVPDAQLTPGSCAVDLVHGGVIEAEVEAQLDKLVRTLLPEASMDSRSEQAA